MGTRRGRSQATQRVAGSDQTLFPARRSAGGERLARIWPNCAGRPRLPLGGLYGSSPRHVGSRRDGATPPFTNEGVPQHALVPIALTPPSIARRSHLNMSAQSSKMPPIASSRVTPCSVGMTTIDYL